MHEFLQLLLYWVPKVRMTTHLKKPNFQPNNDQNDLKLYRYQYTPEKVASVKQKVSISFTSGFSLVNVCR